MAETKQDDNFAFDAIVKANQQMDAEDEAEQQANPMAFSSQGELDTHNNNLVETTVRFLGDRTIIAEIVQLLAYIRHGVKNNVVGDMTVTFGGTVANPSLMMDVNGFQVPDLVIQDKIQIN